MNNNNRQENKGREQKDQELQVIKVGIDLHARQVTFSRQVDQSVPQPAQRMHPRAFVQWVREQQTPGLKIYSCYEAGACGYWLHRELEKVGVKNFVIAPQPMDQGASRQKTDRLDAAVLVDQLDRYLRGNHKVFSVVAVPSEQQEQQRALIRLHRQLLGDRLRAEARGRALLCSQGIEVGGCWWKTKNWKLLSNGLLASWMLETLQSWRAKILDLDKEQNRLRQRIEALAQASDLPKGAGRYSWVVLQSEMRSWERFNNPGQVSSYTGLCPGVHNSNGRGHEGRINRCGNKTVRYTLIEMLWRMVRWQPHYGPIRQLVKGLLSKRAKRRVAVAAARRLAVDLWRLATGRTTAEKLGLIMQKH